MNKNQPVNSPNAMPNDCTTAKNNRRGQVIAQFDSEKVYVPFNQRAEQVAWFASESKPDESGRGIGVGANTPSCRPQ